MGRGRCAPLSVLVVADFSNASYSAKPFLERMGIFEARRNPESKFAPGQLRVHNYPLRPPLPSAALQEHLLGENPPDRGRTLDWPHPDLPAAEDDFSE